MERQETTTSRELERDPSTIRSRSWGSVWGVRSERKRELTKPVVQAHLSGKEATWGRAITQVPGSTPDISREGWEYLPPETLERHFHSITWLGISLFLCVRTLQPDLCILKAYWSDRVVQETNPTLNASVKSRDCIFLPLPCCRSGISYWWCPHQYQQKRIPLGLAHNNRMSSLASTACKAAQRKGKHTANQN